MHPNPCWILCSPRTGSSYLCELLNNTKMFPAYCHPDLKEIKGPIQKGLAFNEWLRLFNTKTQFLTMPPPYCKAIYHQYIEALGSIPTENRYRPGFYFNYYKIENYDHIIATHNDSFLASVLPNITFITLKRKNLIAHAISLYFSRMTKKYHIYDEKSLAIYFDTKITLDSSLLLTCWKDANIYTKLWDKFISTQNSINITYESLIENPTDTLGKLGEFLKLPFEIETTIKRTETENKRIYKMTHPDAKRFESLLKKELIKLS
jgi:LPS sulfotransferase NodH